jgi:hypothetical protein
LELYLLPILQGSAALEVAPVNENIFAVGLGDKTPTLAGVEPFHPPNELNSGLLNSTAARTKLGLEQLGTSFGHFPLLGDSEHKLRPALLASEHLVRIMHLASLVLPKPEFDLLTS